MKMIKSSFYINLNNNIKWRGRILRVVKLGGDVLMETTLEGDIRANGLKVYDAHDTCVGYAYSPLNRLCIRKTPPPRLQFPFLCLQTLGQDEIILCPEGVLVKAYRQERHVIHDTDAVIELLVTDVGERILYPSFAQLLHLFRDTICTSIELYWSNKTNQFIKLSNDIDETFPDSYDSLATGSYWKAVHYNEIFTPSKDGASESDMETDNVSGSDDGASNVDENISEYT